jgi:two-component system sensor histidine kinase/response regulator
VADDGQEVDPSVRLALLDAVLSSVPIGVAVVDRELRYVVVNDALAAMNGVAPRDHVGRTIAEVLGGDVPVVPLVEQVLATGEPVLGIEAEAAAPNLPDVVRRFSSSFHPVREGDEVVGVAAVIVEVTDREQGLEVLQASERRYRTLVEATTSLVWQVRPGEEPHLEWQERIHPDDRDRVTDSWMRAVDTRSVFSEECRILTPGGDVRHVIVRAVPVVEGTVLREWIGASTDVTAARRTEEALRESETRLRLALASGGTGTWDWDLATGRIVWSEETARIFGTTLERSPRASTSRTCAPSRPASPW